jgi:hypothetical protein
VYGPRGHVNERITLFQTFDGAMMFVVIFMALFCFFLFLSKFELGKFEFREQPVGPEAREKGRILAEA